MSLNFYGYQIKGGGTAEEEGWTEEEQEKVLAGRVVLRRLSLILLSISCDRQCAFCASGIQEGLPMACRAPKQALLFSSP